MNTTVAIKINLVARATASSMNNDDQLPSYALKEVIYELLR